MTVAAILPDFPVTMEKIFTLGKTFRSVKPIILHFPILTVIPFEAAVVNRIYFKGTGTFSPYLNDPLPRIDERSSIAWVDWHSVLFDCRPDFPCAGAEPRRRNPDGLG
jgi:hypothetical protein